MDQNTRKTRLAIQPPSLERRGRGRVESLGSQEVKKKRFSPGTLNNARRLRREAPVPERLLWGRLRAGQLGGARFRRQHSIGPYVADFYCPAAKLVIELDGHSHDDRANYDARRTAYMEREGYRVVRFADDEVLKSLDDVVYRIACEVGVWDA